VIDSTLDEVADKLTEAADTVLKLHADEFTAGAVNDWTVIWPLVSDEVRSTGKSEPVTKLSTVMEVVVAVYSLLWRKMMSLVS